MNQGEMLCGRRSVLLIASESPTVSNAEAIRRGADSQSPGSVGRGWRGVLNG